MKLMTEGASNPKTAKSTEFGWLTAGLHLAPYTASGYQVCSDASAGCSAECLYHQGRGKMTSVQTSRIRKTRMYFEQREEFLDYLVKDLGSLERKAERNGLKPCARLNLTSDLYWERHGIMEQFPGTTFYDYTKHKNRKDLPSNYSLAFSRSELTTEADVDSAINKGMNVAVVFANELPDTWHGLPVIDGDKHDLIFLHPHPCIIGLSAKGTAKLDESGFVVFG